MGRLRSFIRSAAKPAAMVGVVGILSLSLVVTTPSTAQALVTYPKIPPAATFIMGATKTVAPVAMAAASFTPVGLGLRLAWLAFSTADLWMPLVTGTFGQDVKPVQGTGTYYGTSDPNFKLGVPVVNGSQVTASETYTCNAAAGATCSLNHHVAYKIQCKNGAGAVITPTSVVSPISGSFPPGVHALGNFGITCPATYPTPSGGVVGLAGSGELPLLTGTQRKTGPGNDVSFGSMRAPNGFDPRGSDVGYQGRSECIDAQGTISWAEGPITPGDNDGATMLMPSCEKAGKGHGTGRTQVKGFKPDGTTETVWDTGANPLMDPATPLCDPGRASSGCVMEVTKDGQPCKMGDVECENWASESKKEGNTRYGCKLGPYMLPASACSLLEQAYMPGGSPLNEPNTDGDPSTRSPLGPAGVPVAAPAPVTNGVPGVSPAPGVSGQPGPGADESARQCWPTGWGMFNPFEWVLKPLRCAFEPTKDVSLIGKVFRDKAEKKLPATLLNLEMIGPGSSGCPTWVISVPGFSQNVICESSFTAAILSIRAPLFGIIATAMVWPLIRSLWYAAIPILRVTPSSGGK